MPALCTGTAARPMWPLSACPGARGRDRVSFDFILIDLLEFGSCGRSAVQYDVFRKLCRSPDGLIWLLRFPAGSQKGPLAERGLKSGMFFSLRERPVLCQVFSDLSHLEGWSFPRLLSRTQRNSSGTANASLVHDPLLGETGSWCPVDTVFKSRIL